MEHKLIRVPFDIDTAKKITNGEIKGKIVTRDGRSARIICWNKKSDSRYNIVGLTDETAIELIHTYTISGNEGAGLIGNADLFLEIPECLTFADGEVVVQSWERDGHYCKWVSIIRDAELWDNDKIATTDYFSVCIDADDNNKFAPCFGGMSNSATDIRKADDSEKEIVINTLNESKDERAKDYLERFFGIEKEEKPKCELKPFDKVLCRDKDNSKWEVDIFRHIIENAVYEYKYSCMCDTWKYCIPYEGNEHLLGTTDDYKEE